MNLHVLFIQRAEGYPGEHAPEARIVWDEFSVDENPDGFDEAIANELDEVPDAVAHRVVCIAVDQDAIRELLLGTPTIAGRLVREDDR